MKVFVKLTEIKNTTNGEKIAVFKGDGVKLEFLNPAVYLQIGHEYELILTQ
jgi:hypothetical protein